MYSTRQSPRSSCASDRSPTQSTAPSAFNSRRRASASHHLSAHESLLPKASALVSQHEFLKASIRQQASVWEQGRARARVRAPPAAPEPHHGLSTGSAPCFSQGTHWHASAPVPAGGTPAATVEGWAPPLPPGAAGAPLWVRCSDLDVFCGVHPRRNETEPADVWVKCKCGPAPSVRPATAPRTPLPPDPSLHCASWPSDTGSGVLLLGRGAARTLTVCPAGKSLPCPRVRLDLDALGRRDLGNRGARAAPHRGFRSRPRGGVAPWPPSCAAAS